MKILIDIGHPAHVHYFRNFILKSKLKGDIVYISARDKEITHQLLDYFGLEYFNRGTGGKGFLGKIIYLFKGVFLLYKYARTVKPDLLLSFGSPYASQVSKIIKKPHIAFDDTEHAKFEHLLYVPPAKYIFTPLCFKKNFGKKHFKFNGYMELSYLHNKYFNPNENIKNDLGVKNGEKYIIIRFISWDASHDFGHKGILTENKIKAVKEFEKYGKVFISSEGKLPRELESYRIPIASNQMHDALAYASLLYGESATMASECSVLGTPSIFLDNSGRGYTDEQENKYGIVFNFSESIKDQEESIKKGIKILQLKDGEDIFRKKSNKIQKDKIDTTDFMLWILTDYPKNIDKLSIDSKAYGEK